VWDHGKEQVKDYHELYKMPDFGMSAREADAVLANVLGFTEESVLASRRAGAQEPRTAALAEGRRLMTRYNCQGCHLIEGHGQAIRSAISDPGLLPPNLAAEGARVQSDWLFDFLHDPGRVRLRPWLSVRMPTFAFSDQQANTLVGYFAAHDRAEPFASPAPAGDPQSVAAGGVVFSMLQCAKCHPAGPQAEAGASTAELAPSLLLARSRLRHGWVPSWILDPQSWVPGTRMPANFQRLPSGEYQGPPFAQALQAPMFSSQRAALLRQFGSEEAMIAFLGDPEKVTTALRDYVWTLDRGERGRAAAAP
jgi:mono/diheme cytochrome c family protein